MVQKEVAQRLYAKTGTKFYGRTSVLTQANASVKEKIEVDADNFFPKPKVTSAVIEIIPTPRKFDYESLDGGIKSLFLHRRKILKNNLKNLNSETESKIRECGISLSSRPQDLNPADYIKLSKILLINFSINSNINFCLTSFFLSAFRIVNTSSALFLYLYL